MAQQRGIVVVHITDLHITDDGRFDDQCADFERLVTQAIEVIDPDLWLITGDIFKHVTGQRSNFRERMLMESMVLRMASTGPVVVVYGNHDPDLELHGLERLDRQYPIMVFDRPVPQGERIWTKGGFVTVYPLPWPTKRYLVGATGAGADEAHAGIEMMLRSLLMSWSVTIDAARQENPGEPHILAAHIQVGGCVTAGGEVLSGGDIQITKGDLDLLRVDYGAFGHIHLAQELVERCWYAGSPWYQDHGEAKRIPGWAVIRFLPQPSAIPGRTLHRQIYDTQGRLPMEFSLYATGCRPFLTLEYEWGERDGVVTWLRYPTLEDMTLVRGAEVRMRLTVHESYHGSCPWDAEQIAVAAAGAARIKTVKNIEVSMRTRVPELTASREMGTTAPATIEAELEAYWPYTNPPPNEQERVLALRRLMFLREQMVEQQAST